MSCNQFDRSAVFQFVDAVWENSGSQLMCGYAKGDLCNHQVGLSKSEYEYLYIENRGSDEIL